MSHPTSTEPVPAGHTRLTLDLDLGAEPVAGVLSGACGDAEEFVGWTGLTRAIELALEASRGAAVAARAEGER